MLYNTKITLITKYYITLSHYDYLIALQIRS